MANTESDALVFFGATGDLAYKQIFPALYALSKRGRLDVPVVGVAKAGWGLEQLRARAKESIAKHGDLDPAAFETLAQKLRYVDGDYRDAKTFDALKEALGGASRPLHYLAIPPALFASVAEGLATAGCAKNARVVVEKPFGRDLASARELNRVLHETFPEESIFRIDHYLGKEPVQNLVYFRAANSLLEAAWNGSHIASVEVTMAESFGVAGRGTLYDEVGAVRDVVQNHMLQVIAAVAMELPTSHHDESIRNARGALLQSIVPLTPGDIVRGQFEGFRREPGVAPASTTETFAALRLAIDSPRWKGVPFCIRAGKSLPVTATEVLVRFHRARQPVLDDTTVSKQNHYRFRLGPEVLIALSTNVKMPGERLVGEQIELVARHQQPGEMQAYERLLGDALRGDTMLFAREDSVEAAWRVVDPILEAPHEVFPYTPGTWGPAEAASVGPDGGWHDPVTEAKHPC